MDFSERKVAIPGGRNMDILHNYFDGFQATVIIEEACELGLVDVVGRFPEGVGASDVAVSEGWDPDATSRLMDALASLKVLTKGKNTSGKYVFQVSDMGQHLLKDSPATIRPILSMLGTGMFPGLRSTAKIVRSGASKEGHGGHHHQHGEGSDDSNPFHSKLTWAHYRAIGSTMTPYLRELIRVYDLSHYKSAVDLGAGSGELGLGLLEAYPDMHITLNDVSEVTELLQQNLLDKKELGNVSLLSGSFLEVELPKADLFVISRALHHLDKDKQRQLIARVYSSINPGGAFLILEKFLCADRVGPSKANVWDVLLVGDKDCLMVSDNECGQLLREAGFSEVEVARTDAECLFDIMIGRKA